MSLPISIFLTYLPANSYFKNICIPPFFFPPSLETIERFTCDVCDIVYSYSIVPHSHLQKRKALQIGFQVVKNHLLDPTFLLNSSFSAAVLALNLASSIHTETSLSVDPVFASKVLILLREQARVPRISLGNTKQFEFDFLVFVPRSGLRASSRSGLVVLDGMIRCSISLQRTSNIVFP
ncbi:hypothetical protein VTN96DRAFT_2284 [Rasamsonia emersonii]